MRAALWRLASFLTAAGFIAAWQIVANFKWVSPVFLPGPDRAWAALVHGMVASNLAVKLAGTIEHMLEGWLLASIAGIALGINTLHLGLWSVPLGWTAGWIFRGVVTTLRLRSGDWERRRLAV